MGQSFDELSRAVSTGHSRRSVLKMLGGAAAAAVGSTLVRPFRADAACPAGTTPCGPTCCPKGVACVNARNGICGCPAGQTACGTDPTGQPVCCTGTCSNPATHCCCASGTTPCGPNCCQKGVACVDKTSGTCGCPPGTTPCGTGANLTCCSAGQPCRADSVCAPPSGTSAGCAGANTCSNCTTCHEGDQPICGTVPGTGGGESCLCFKRVNGQCACVIPTCLSQQCETDADCGGGAVCGAGTGCCPQEGSVGLCIPLCNGGGSPCGNVPICQPTCGGGECALVSTAAGTCACVQPHCGPSCGSDSDCGSGQVCAAAECCQGNVCTNLCGAPAATPAASGTTWGPRSTPGPYSP